MEIKPNKHNRKRISLSKPKRRASPGVEDPPLPSISLPWVPLLLESAVLSSDYTDFKPKINRHRFIDEVHRLGGWETLGKESRWRALLNAATHAKRGWLNDGVPDPTESKLWPLRKAAIEALGVNGYTALPYWAMGHHLRLKVYVRTISKVRHETTGRNKPWIGAGKVIPAAMTALRGVLWVSDDQIRDVQIRVEPTDAQYYRDIWTVRVEECFAEDLPDWVREDPDGLFLEPEA